LPDGCWMNQKKTLTTAYMENSSRSYQKRDCVA